MPQPDKRCRLDALTPRRLDASLEAASSVPVEECLSKVGLCARISDSDGRTPAVPVSESCCEIDSRSHCQGCRADGSHLVASSLGVALLSDQSSHLADHDLGIQSAHVSQPSLPVSLVPASGPHPCWPWVQCAAFNPRDTARDTAICPYRPVQFVGDVGEQHRLRALCAGLSFDDCNQ